MQGGTYPFDCGTHAANVPGKGTSDFSVHVASSHETQSAGRFSGVADTTLTVASKDTRKRFIAACTRVGSRKQNRGYWLRIRISQPRITAKTPSTPCGAEVESLCNTALEQTLQLGRDTTQVVGKFTYFTLPGSKRHGPYLGRKARYARSNLVGPWCCAQ